MAGYCLSHGIIQKTEEPAEFQAAAIFHLAADGSVRKLSERPDLSEGEGLLIYAGDFYVEPLEIQIEFLKAESAERWLEALALRHVERVRQVADDLFVLAEFGEENV